MIPICQLTGIAAMKGVIPWSFFLPLNDIGGGIANISPAFSLGSPTPTYSRAAIAWTKLPTGLWAPVASGQPRATYLGLTTAITAYAGYFAEGTATQQVTPTASIRDMTDASWVATNITPTKNATGIDGVANSCTTLTATAANGTILKTLVQAAVGSVYSYWVRRKTGSGVINFTQDGGSTWTAIAAINTSTYTLVQLSATVLNPVFGIRIVSSGDAIEVDFNQFEAGLFATSPMDTAGMTRPPDALTFAFASNALAATGTCYCEASTHRSNTLPGSLPLIQFDNNISRGPLICSNNAPTTMSTNDSTTTITKTGLATQLNAVKKFASSWGAGVLSVTGSGATAATGAFDGSMPSTAIGIGCRTSGLVAYNGAMKNVKIYTTVQNIVTLTT